MGPRSSVVVKVKVVVCILVVVFIHMFTENVNKNIVQSTSLSTLG